MLPKTVIKMEEKPVPDDKVCVTIKEGIVVTEGVLKITWSDIEIETPAIPVGYEFHGSLEMSGVLRKKEE